MAQCAPASPQRMALSRSSIVIGWMPPAANRPAAVKRSAIGLRSIFVFLGQQSEGGQPSLGSDEHPAVDDQRDAELRGGIDGVASSRGLVAVVEFDRKVARVVGMQRAGPGTALLHRPE